MEDRVRFVVEAEASESSVRELCWRHGISRQTGHKWLRRWREGGAQALQDASRAPLSRPRAVDAQVAQALVLKRRERPHWGPKKLLAVLREERPEVAWPAVSTAGDVLKRAGLVETRRRQRRAEPQERPFAQAVSANDEWSIDFKGWFRTRDGRRCDPLTVSDTASRMLLECRMMAQKAGLVGLACERLFREVGLPGRLRMDNGTPWGSRGPAGLTRLSVGWLKLGIEVLLIEPGCPGQNGRHERMHGVLRAETAMEPAASLEEQQARFDRFRREYNEERPHEALGQVPPARVWRPSARGYPVRVEEVWYPADHQVRRVKGKGEINWRGGTLLIGAALRGEPIGLLELPSGHWLVRFMCTDLGVIDRVTGAFRAYGPGRPARPIGTEQNKETVSHVSGLICQ